MKASKFSDAQKAFILKQGADGTPVADICRKAGISQATYFNWKRKYDGLLPTEMRRLKQLEDENGKLRNFGRGSNCCWMKVQWQVSSGRISFEARALCALAPQDDGDRLCAGLHAKNGARRKRNK